MVPLLPFYVFYSIDFFKVSWSDTLQQGIAFNALEACAYLGIDAVALDRLWRQCEAENKRAKLGGGFYCGLIDTVPDKGPIYVFNGFFMSMRAKFVCPGTSIHYYVVEFDSSHLTWADFRGRVLGPTDPNAAPPDSIRGTILAQWQSLNLAAEPNVGDNSVHASASPFEGLAERMNWLGVDCASDGFGSKLLAAGISLDIIKAWTVDPQVKGASLFDSLEDLDCDAALQKAVELAS